MAKYRWDLNDMKNNLFLLEQLLDKTLDVTQKNTIIETITQYNMMQSYIATRKQKTDDREDKNITLSEYMQEFMEYLVPSDENLINVILSTFELIKNFNFSLAHDYLLTFNNDDLLELCDDFMRTTLPPAIFTKYQNELLKNPRHLHIKSLFSDNNGLTFIDPVLKKKYILINRRNEITDLYVLPHEYFHFIFNDFRSYLSFDNQMYSSQELEGSLANLLFADYFRNLNDSSQNYNISKQMNQEFLYYYQIRTASLLILMGFIDATNKGKLRTNKFNKFLNYFGFETPLSAQEIKDYIGTETADEAIKNNLSSLAALDLFEIYKNDPELCFYLLQNIRFIKQNNDVLSVFRRNHITFMDDNFENLKKYIKKTERL